MKSRQTDGLRTAVTFWKTGRHKQALWGTCDEALWQPLLKQCGERAGVLRGGHMTKHLLHSELHLVSRVTRVYIALHTIEIYNTLPQKQTGNNTISGANFIKYEAKYSYTTVSFFSSVQFNVHSVFVFTWLTSFSVKLWENKPVRNEDVHFKQNSLV